MALLDRQGRLFGKFSILDIGAIATILIVLIGLLIVRLLFAINHAAKSPSKKSRSQPQKLLRQKLMALRFILMILVRSRPLNLTLPSPSKQ